MKVLFVDLFSPFFDQFGIYAISSALKKSGIDHEYIKVHGESAQAAAERIKESNCDLVLYSSFSGKLNEYIKFDEEIKKYVKVPSLIGGHGATYEWEKLLSTTIDFVCIGEGELALVEFLKNGLVPVKNVISSTTGYTGDFFKLVDPDEFDYDCRELVYSADPLLRDYPYKGFISGKGCLNSCTYCFNHVYNRLFKDCGDIVRKKSVDHFIDEILFVKNKYGLKHAVFKDDAFNIDSKWLEEFCEKYPQRVSKIGYTCQLDISRVDESQIKMLSESGCEGVFLAFESGNEAIRGELLRRRPITNQLIVEKGKLFRKYGIKTKVSNIVGLPGESLDQVHETIQLNVNAKTYFSYGGLFYPFPGTKLTKYAVENNYFVESNYNLKSGDDLGKSILFNPFIKKDVLDKLPDLFIIATALPFYNRKVCSALLLLPSFILKGLCQLIVFYKNFMFFKMYKIKPSISLRIFWRFAMGVSGH